MDCSGLWRSADNHWRALECRRTPEGGYMLRHERNYVWRHIDRANVETAVKTHWWIPVYPDSIALPPGI